MGTDNVCPLEVVGVGSASVYTQPILVMQHRDRKGTSPKCRVCLSGCCTIPSIPWGSMLVQTHCQPIHKQEDEGSKTISSSFLAMIFLVLSTQILQSVLWHRVDLHAHCKNRLIEAWIQLGMIFLDTTVWIRPVGSSTFHNKRTDNEEWHLANRKFSSALDSYYLMKILEGILSLPVQII